RTPDVPIVGDVRKVLEQMLERSRDSDFITDANLTKPWLDQINYWRKEYPMTAPLPEQGLSPQEVIVELNNQAPQAFYTTDVGQHQMWAAQFLKNGPRRWISSAGLGTMGYGLAAAMGVKVAIPDEETICISGDASFQMNPQELGTLAQFGINVKTVIINNGWQGMVRQWQESFFGQRYSSSNMEVGAPDFVILAQAYGIKGMIVHDRPELASAIAEMLAHDGPVLMDVRVTQDENCYPMIAPGKSNAHMLGLPQKEQPTAEFINCDSCGTMNPTANKFCPECGNQL
ncbi:MAG: thiamine pyrophosphate-dependent enzyme, partial [Waterburya sp.]